MGSLDDKKETCNKHLCIQNCSCQHWSDAFLLPGDGWMLSWPNVIWHSPRALCLFLYFLIWTNFLSIFFLKRFGPTWKKSLIGELKSVSDSPVVDRPDTCPTISSLFPSGSKAQTNPESKTVKRSIQACDEHQTQHWPFFAPLHALFQASCYATALYSLSNTTAAPSFLYIPPHGGSLLNFAGFLLLGTHNILSPRWVALTMTFGGFCIEYDHRYAHIQMAQSASLCIYEASEPLLHTFKG